MIFCIFQFFATNKASATYINSRNQIDNCSNKTPLSIYQEDVYKEISCTNTCNDTTVSENNMEELSSLERQAYIEMMKNKELIKTLENSGLLENPNVLQTLDPMVKESDLECYQGNQNPCQFESYKKDTSLCQYPGPLSYHLTPDRSLYSSNATNPYKRQKKTPIEDKKSNETCTYNNEHTATYLQSQVADSTHHDITRVSITYPIPGSLSQNYIGSNIIDEYNCEIMDYQVRTYGRWTEIVYSRQAQWLTNLFNILKFINQPNKLTQLFSIIDIGQSDGFLFNCKFFHLLSSKYSRCKDIVAEYESIKDVSQVHPYAFKYATSAEGFGLCSPDQYVSYYVEYVRSLCFNIHAKNGRLILKVELLHIVEFLPEFFHYILFKTRDVKKILVTSDLVNSLFAELRTIYELVNTFSFITKSRDQPKQGTHALIINFRDHVLSYLAKHHSESEILYFYTLCDITIDRNQFLKVSGDIYLSLSLCFTFDFSELKNVLEKKCLKMHPIERKIVNMYKIRRFFRNTIYQKILFNSALYKLIDIHEQTMNDVFGVASNNLMYFPNGCFVLVVKICESTATIYVIRKCDFAIHLLYELIRRSELSASHTGV